MGGGRRPPREAALKEIEDQINAIDERFDDQMSSHQADALWARGKKGSLRGDGPNARPDGMHSGPLSVWLCTFWPCLLAQEQVASRHESRVSYVWSRDHT